MAVVGCSRRGALALQIVADSAVMLSQFVIIDIVYLAGSGAFENKLGSIYKLDACLYSVGNWPGCHIELVHS